MIVLLLVSQNEADLLRWNLRHHLEWGVDHIGVADNDSSDETADVVREFGDAVSYQRFVDFHDRQDVRLAMLDAVRAARSVEWAGVADTDEFFWSSRGGPRELLADAPMDVVAVNFDMKLFLPTVLDDPTLPVFMSRVYRTSSSASPLHTSYRAGKTFYRSSWLERITDEHWCGEVPHDQHRHAEQAVHHYMVRDEDQFVQKVTRLISWAPEPSGLLARRRWRRTPEIERPLPGWSAPFKKDWWAVYQRGGEPALRDYYRARYTLSEERLRGAIAEGVIVEDGAFAAWARARYTAVE